MRGGDEQSLEGVWHKGPGLGRMQCSQRDGHCGWGPWCQPSSCWKPPASNAAAPLAYLLQSPTPPRLSRTCSRLQRCRASRVLDSPPTRDNQPRHSVVHEGQPTASFTQPPGQPTGRPAAPQNGLTGLHAAAFNGHAEAARVLLDHGAVVERGSESPISREPAQACI